MRKDKFTKPQRSQLMARIKSKETSFENRIFKEVRKSGVRFRKHYVGIIGNPDIALPRRRKAVFLHSDFWHGWRLPRWENVLPSDFWKDKLHKNRKRDRKVLLALRKRGWRVLVVWEHRIKKDPIGTTKRIVSFLKSK